VWLLVGEADIEAACDALASSCSTWPSATSISAMVK
jgi:hypothetical protein